MSAPTPIIRKFAIARFAPFARNARAALQHSGIDALEHAKIFQMHIAARCCLCEARLSPEVVAALLTGSELDAGRPADELGRLRLEYCLRTACDSRFYELTFAPHPSVDWSSIGTEALPEAQYSSVRLEVGSVAVRKISNAVRAQMTWKLAAALVLLISLLVWRQWWTGGSILFFREARTFTSEGVGLDPMGDDDDPK